MNSVGIDISKNRSTVAVMRPFGDVVISPFEVGHTVSELSELAKRLKSLDGETRVVMEVTKFSDLEDEDKDNQGPLFCLTFTTIKLP